MKARALVLAAAGVGLVLTAVVILVPTVRFAYESPPLHVALETTAILIGGLAALLIFGRFRQTGSSQDLVLVYVLGVLAMTNFFLAAVPSLMAVPRNEVFLAWAQATARFVAGVVLAGAAFAPETRVRHRGVAGVSVAAASFGTLFLIALAALIATPFLPDPLGPVVVSAESFRPKVEGHPVFLALQLGQMAAFGLAAVGFLRSAEREEGAITAWVAAGCVLSAISRFNYFLFPSRYTDYVYVGDLLRLGFYLCLLIGGIREISSYWRSLALVEVGEARRRLASDLHDGVAQELVFITAQANRMVKRGADAHDLQRLASAADRAVAESRRAINALSSREEQSLMEALEELGEEMARRVGARVKLDLEPVESTSQTREALIRIAREALSNALRHSSSDVVRLELRDRDGPWIKISDTGVGFDPEDDDYRRKGFGLVSLTERAKALGGEATVSSAPGIGTEVVVRVPGGRGPAAAS